MSHLRRAALADIVRQAEVGSKRERSKGQAEDAPLQTCNHGGRRRLTARARGYQKRLE